MNVPESDIHWDHVLIAFLIAVIVVLLCVMWIGSARAHGLEQWIANKELHDPKTGMWCCGPNDCHALADGDVQEVAGGWSIKEDGELAPEFIPYERGLPVAQDGKYHRCGNGGWGGPFGSPKQPMHFVFHTRCFIIPPGSS